MKNKYLYIQTFGCQMNVHDSEQMAELMSGIGYKLTDNMKMADLIILNTCSIREKAAQKSYSQLGRIGKLKEQNPELIIGVGGCLAQYLGTKFHKKVGCLDFVFGTHNIHLLPGIVSSFEKTKGKITKVDFHKTLNSINVFTTPRESAVSAFVTIMQGCNNFCAYCVVPYLRGPEMSRPSDDIIEEIKKLADLGIKEVTLLGQNVNSYGRTLNDGCNFTSLIKKISKISGIKRIRFTTSHPRDFSPELINCFVEEEKLCKHIHLPVQSGSNKILALMNRGYIVDEYIKKIDHLRDLVPQISVTSDVIVGFPGETKKDYQETIDMMEKIRFDSLFSFKYSEREMTAAQKLKGKVEEDEKLRRLEKLQRLQNQHTLERNTKLEGSVQELLVERTSKHSEGDLMGRTSSWKIVNFKGELELISKLVDVKISKAYIHSLREKYSKEAGSVN